MDDDLTRWLMSDSFGLEDPSPDVPAWFAQAACAGRDQHDWFPDKGASYVAARAVCDGCQVRSKCLSHALAVEGDLGPTYRFGLWGGMTPKERAQLDRQAA